MTSTCPQCDGTGETAPKLEIAYDGERDAAYTTTQCRRCRGTGYIVPDWEHRGAACRQRRIQSAMLLQDIADRMGVRASDVSAQETGRADPAALEAFWENGDD